MSNPELSKKTDVIGNIIPKPNSSKNEAKNIKSEKKVNFFLLFFIKK